MTKPLPFTESAVRRAVSAARKAGLQVNAVSVAPDGTVTVYQGLEPFEPPRRDDNKESSEWADA
jgi:hypothetical protein